MYAGVLCRRLCGVNTEKSLPDISIAVTLPIPVKKPPHNNALRFGGEPDGPGIINDATLFPASFAPFVKARANRAANPICSMGNDPETFFEKKSSLYRNT